MNENKKNIVNIASIIALLLLGGYFLVRGTAPSERSTKTATDTTSSETIATTTNIAITDGTISVNGTGDYTIQEIPVENSAPKQKAPDYNVPLVFPSSSNLTAEQETALKGQAEAIKAQLRQDSSSYSAWLALGGIFLSSGDYAQVEKIWKYVSLNWPSDATVEGNLGDLYLTYLKDYPKAELSYLAAIRKDPQQTNAYRNLLSMYTNMYKTNTTAAEDILKKGIKNNPDALDLYVALAHYYRDHGQTAEAMAAYDVAIAQAKRLATAANFGAVADLEAEQSVLQ